MAILRDSQARLASVGEIRLGAIKSEKAPGRPLDAFRFSSMHLHLLEKLQAKFGGTIEPWKEKPGMFNLFSAAKILPAYLSLKRTGDGDTESITKFNEWRDPNQKGKLMRKCDGANCLTWVGESRQTVPCLCKANGDGLCKVRTMVNLILPDCSEFGTWKLVTGSQVFDLETEGFKNLMAGIAPEVTIVPVRLTLTFRYKETAPNKPAGKFPVVTISRDHEPTPFAALAGQMRDQLMAPVSLGQLPVSTPTLPPAAVETPVDPPEVEWLRKLLPEQVLSDYQSALESADVPNKEAKFQKLVQGSYERQVTAERFCELLDALIGGEE